MASELEWTRQRDLLLGQRISDLGLSIHGSRVERLIDQLHQELGDKGLRYRPPAYLSDQWGCPDGTPLIGIPFYLADPRLERIEEEMAMSVESDQEAMRYLRHEAGHAFNYAFRLYERPDWQSVFGSFTRPYRDRYRADPFSRDHVRHILGWYAQKHPDEDFAETFAVWLTPDSNWREEYAGWRALDKLEYVDAIMRGVASEDPGSLTPDEDDLPVTAMRYSLAEHYRLERDAVPIEDERQFDVDLRQIFIAERDAPAAELADAFLRRHYREIVSRVAFWTSEHPSVIRSLIDAIARRAEALRLRVGRLEAATLIELTAFATAVVMLYRHTKVMGRARRSGGARARSALVP
ncbi:MAG: putative zinc-binding metallopeptidase [Gemmatimonadaceae bacterium]